MVGLLRDFLRRGRRLLVGAVISDIDLNYVLGHDLFAFMDDGFDLRISPLRVKVFIEIIADTIRNLI